MVLQHRYAAIIPLKSKHLQLKEVLQLFSHEQLKWKPCDYLLTIFASIYP